MRCVASTFVVGSVDCTQEEVVVGVTLGVRNAGGRCLRYQKWRPNRCLREQRGNYRVHDFLSDVMKGVY